LPIWLQPGLMSWNKGSIEFDNGNKILTAASNSNAFRGYSLSILYCSHEEEIVTVKNKKTGLVENISLKELRARLDEGVQMIVNNDYEILTHKGFRDFKGLKESKHNEYIKIYYHDGSDFTCSKDHKMIIDDEIVEVMSLLPGTTIGNKIINSIAIISSANNETFYDPVAVEFTGSYLIDGVIQKNCDEAAFLRNSDYEEFMDSVMPAMAAIQDSQAIFSSTANGLNFFYHMVQGAIKDINGYNLVQADWKEVPRWDKDGSILSHEEFKRREVAKNGLIHFEQNFGNCVCFDTKIEIEGMGELKIGELYESL